MYSMSPQWDLKIWKSVSTEAASVLYASDDLLETLQPQQSVPCGIDGEHLCLVQGNGSDGQQQ